MKMIALSAGCVSACVSVMFLIIIIRAWNENRELLRKLCGGSDTERIVAAKRLIEVDADAAIRNMLECMRETWLSERAAGEPGRAGRPYSGWTTSNMEEIILNLPESAYIPLLDATVNEDEIIGALAMNALEKIYGKRNMEIYVELAVVGSISRDVTMPATIRAVAERVLRELKAKAE